MALGSVSTNSKDNPADELVDVMNQNRTAHKSSSLVDNSGILFRSFFSFPPPGRGERKSTRGFSGFPYPMTLLNCALWVLYGMPFVHPNNILVVTVNGAGMVFEIVYTALFLIFCMEKNEKRGVVGFLALITVFFAAVTSLGLTLEHTHDKRSLVIGTICIIFNFFMYAAPLSVMKRVIRTKSVKYIPFYLSLGCFANGLIWAVYGIIHFDINLVLPNGLGSLLGACQLILYAIYHRTTKWDEDDENESGDPEKNGVGNSQPMKIMPNVGHTDDVDRNGSL